MALSILDGNQSATTLSTILSSGQHITAHTVVSLGTQAITDMRGAVSGSVVSISNFPASQPISGTVSVRTDLDVNTSKPCVALAFDSPLGVQRVGNTNGFPIRPMQDGLGNSIPLEISGTVTLGASTSQIGSVTASISGTVPVSGTFFQGTQPVSLTTLPALVAGTAQIGSVTASISANPSGALTTRFGSVTTANTAQITTAVTNTSRKYLFAQNISIGSVTMGIGFSPTTTQGIQLSAGSGIVFDSFCPTGAVYWLGATTGAAWSILEG